MPDPAPGTLLRVLATKLNAESRFWAPYVGLTARLVQVDADGLWTVVIEEPATTGWLSSLSGNIILDPEPPVVPPPADPAQQIEVWTKVDLPARYNPVPAAKPARFQIIGLPPAAFPKRTSWWARVLRFVGRG